MTGMLATESMVDVLLAEHEELDQRISNIRQLWLDVDQSGDGPDFVAMAAELSKLRPMLAQHFEHEEENGFLNDAILQAPRLSRQADDLLAEHRSFLECVDRMTQRLSGRGEAYSSWRAVSVDLEAFVDTLHTHEQAENNLLQSAWFDDIGVGD